MHCVFHGVSRYLGYFCPFLDNPGGTGGHRYCQCWCMCFMCRVESILNTSWRPVWSFEAKLILCSFFIIQKMLGLTISFLFLKAFSVPRCFDFLVDCWQRCAGPLKNIICVFGMIFVKILKSQIFTSPCQNCAWKMMFKLKPFFCTSAKLQWIWGRDICCQVLLLQFWPTVLRYSPIRLSNFSSFSHFFGLYYINLFSEC